MSEHEHNSLCEGCVKFTSGLYIENAKLKAEVAGTLIPHSARCLDMEKALVAEWKLRKCREALEEALIILPCGGHTMRPCTVCDIREVLEETK